MSITRSLANQGYKQENTSDVVLSRTLLKGYRYRWVTGKVFAKSVTPLWSNAPTFGGGVFTEYAYSNELPTDFETLEEFSVAVSHMTYSSRWFYKRVAKTRMA